jgi:hypothetical protein
MFEPLTRHGPLKQGGPDRIGWIVSLMMPWEGTHLHLLNPRDG